MIELLPYDQTARRPELIEAMVILLLPEHGATVVSLLSSASDLIPSLKRIRPHKCEGKRLLEAVLGPLKNGIPEEVRKYAETCDVCGETEIKALVPASPPYTREQCELWSHYWPCSFKLPSIVPLVHSPAETLEIIEKVMKLRPTDTLIVHQTLGISVLERDRDDSPLHHSTMMALDEFSRSHGSEEQYYCTGAYVYMKREPCLMCAMALVHSRIERLYFEETQSRGAFSKWELHRQPLNYMYRVVQVSAQS